MFEVAELNMNLNRDLHAISDSYLKHYLKLNAGTTVALLFCPEKNETDLI